MRRRSASGEAKRENGRLGRFSAASLLFLGLVLGLAGGLYYAWIVDPVVFTDASPARLSAAYQEEYIFLVSQSYAVNGDLALARERLATLDNPQVTQQVTALLERYVREQRTAVVIQHLAALARDLGATAPAVALFAPTPISGQPTPTFTPTTSARPTLTATVTPTPTNTPLPTNTPFPTATVPPTAQPTYRLLNQQRVCGNEPAARIEVVTLDALLNPLPGVEVLVQWEGGSDRFFTGFKPAVEPAYGDFTMTTANSYAVMLADGSPEVSGLRIETCDNGLDGGWRLTFQNLITRLPSPTATP